MAYCQWQLHITHYSGKILNAVWLWTAFMFDTNKELIIFSAHFDWTRQIFKNRFLSHASRKNINLNVELICSNSKYILLPPLIIHNGEEDLYELCMFLCFFSFVGSLCRCHRWQGCAWNDQANPEGHPRQLMCRPHELCWSWWQARHTGHKNPSLSCW